MPAQHHTPQVNLIREHARDVKRKRLMVAKTQMYSGGVLVVYLAILIGIFAIRGVFALQVKQTKNAIASEELALAKLKPIESKYILVNNKLTLVSDFVSERTDVKQLLTQLYQLIPENVGVTEFTFDQAANTLEVKFEAADVQTMAAWLPNVEAGVKNGFYSKVDFDKLSRDDTGVYMTTATFTLQTMQGKQST